MLEDTASRRLHRADVSQSVRAAGGYDPVGAVHRRAGEPGHPVLVRALSEPGRAGGGNARRRSSRRFSRPASSGSSPGRWSAWHEPWSSTTDGDGACGSRCAGAIAGRGSQDGQRGARARARGAGAPGRPARAPRGQPPGDRTVRVTRSSWNGSWETALPKARWTLASDTLILHGRRICKPRPLCDRCRVRNDCLYLAEGGPTAPARGPGRARRPSGFRKSGVP